MMNSKLTARRAMFPLLALGLIVPACVGDPELGDDELLASDSDENVAEASEALTTVTTTRGPVANSSCNANSKVSFSLASEFNDTDKLAPWKTLAVNGTFSLGSGANGVQFRYWVGTDSSMTQTDAMAANAAAGSWSWTKSLTCERQVFSVCAIPYVNGNACGDLSSNASSGYRVCKNIVFQGCSNAIGVIPDVNTSCPAGADTLTRHMDDEDGKNFPNINNNNDHSGWIGATGSSNNTDLKFCRVDGRTFKPLMGCNGLTVDTPRDYAVLKLGSVCPNGSVEFEKFIDNENDNNDNWYYDSSGDHAPNNYLWGDTRLHFCFFGTASSVSATMGSFPSLGIPYGVFGRSTLVNAGEASTYGWFRSDDEDSGSDSYSAPSSIFSRAVQIISNADQNTTFNTAKVITSTIQGTGFECEVCGNGICRAAETLWSCEADCAYCGDQICNNGETPSSCPDDCGFCGDGVCNGDETPSTCSRDCRNGCGDGVCDATEVNTCPADCW